MGQFGRALQDALKAKELNPKWPKVRLLFLDFRPDSAFFREKSEEAIPTFPYTYFYN
jgi:hypothetical protein